MNKLVSIDSSTKCTGIAYFENGQLKKHGIIDMHLEKEVQHRTSEMGLRIMRALNAFSPDTVAIERPRGHNNPQILRKLTTLVGMVRGWCVWHDLKYVEIAPTQWRKVLEFRQGRGVKRQEQKAQSLEYVKTRYGIEAKTDDEADAICIGCSLIKEESEKN